MNITNTPKIKNLPLLPIILIAVANIAILFDIPFLRQVAGILLLTFVPGLLIVYILRSKDIGLTTITVLSVGLSVAFAMLFGILISSLLHAIGNT